MIAVTVFRKIPPRIIGMIGTRYDPAFERFEASLDWLETTGVVVEQFDPAAAPEEVASRPTVQKLLATEGPRCLPLILVNGSVVSRGTYLSRARLARAVGRAQAGERSAWAV
jgi:hypothetical protein